MTDFNRIRVGTRPPFFIVLVILFMTLTTGIMSPRATYAQDDNRQKTKNNWRNIAIGAAGLSAFGFIKNDPRIGFVGAAGSLYSLNRYEQDRKSQSQASKARASIFSHKTIYRNGKKYHRQVVTRKGKKYYQLVRG